MSVLSPTVEQSLASLHDIHLPLSTGWWPLAPIWYGLFLLFMGVIFFFWRMHYLGRVRREALRTLAVYEAQYHHAHDSQQSSANVSELLKRYALVYYPRHAVAGLQGEAWILFLNKAGRGIDFNLVRAELLEYPYQLPHQKDVSLLFSTARAFIKRGRKPCSN